MIDIKRLDTSSVDFQQQLDAVLAWDASSDATVIETVRGILADVKSRGDAAVLEYSRRFDRVVAESMADLELPLARAEQALLSIPTAQREALEAAAERVRA